MTRNNFIAIAAALKAVKPQSSSEAEYVTWRNCVIAVMDVLQQSNPRFNQGKFIAACGVPNLLME